MEEDLRTGKYRRSKLLPILWDLPTQTLFCSATGASFEKLAEIFERTFGLELSPLTSGSSASAPARAQGRKRDYEDMKPTRFVVGPEAKGRPRIIPGWPKAPSPRIPRPTSSAVALARSRRPPSHVAIEKGEVTIFSTSRSIWTAPTAKPARIPSAATAPPACPKRAMRSAPASCRASRPDARRESAAIFLTLSGDSMAWQREIAGCRGSRIPARIFRGARRPIARPLHDDRRAVRAFLRSARHPPGRADQRDSQMDHEARQGPPRRERHSVDFKIASRPTRLAGRLAAVFLANVNGMQACRLNVDSENCTNSHSFIQARVHYARSKCPRRLSPRSMLLNDPLGISGVTF